MDKMNQIVQELVLKYNDPFQEDITQEFDLLHQVSGENNCNVQFIENTTNAIVSVKPQWSGIKDGLLFSIKHISYESVRHAEDLLYKLLDKVKGDFDDFKDDLRISHKAVSMVYKSRYVKCAECGKTLVLTLDEFGSHLKEHLYPNKTDDSSPEEYYAQTDQERDRDYGNQAPYPQEEYSDSYRDDYTRSLSSSDDRHDRERKSGVAPIKFTISSQKKESAVDNSATQKWLKKLGVTSIWSDSDSEPEIPSRQSDKKSSRNRMRSPRRHRSRSPRRRRSRSRSRNRSPRSRHRSEKLHRARTRSLSAERLGHRRRSDRSRRSRSHSRGRHRRDLSSRSRSLSPRRTRHRSRSAERSARRRHKSKSPSTTAKYSSFSYLTQNNYGGPQDVSGSGHSGTWVHPSAVNTAQAAGAPIVVPNVPTEPQHIPTVSHGFPSHQPQWPGHGMPVHGMPVHGMPVHGMPVHGMPYHMSPRMPPFPHGMPPYHYGPPGGMMVRHPRFPGPFPPFPGPMAHAPPWAPRGPTTAPSTSASTSEPPPEECYTDVTDEMIENPHISEPMYVARARMNILMRDRTEGRLNNGRASHLIYLLLSCVDVKEKAVIMEKVRMEFERAGIDPNDKSDDTVSLTSSIKLTVVCEFFVKRSREMGDRLVHSYRYRKQLKNIPSSSAHSSLVRAERSTNSAKALHDDDSSSGGEPVPPGVEMFQQSTLSAQNKPGKRSAFRSRNGQYAFVPKTLYEGMDGFLLGFVVTLADQNKISHFYSIEKNDDKHRAKLALAGDTFTASGESAWDAKKKAAARALMETSYRFSEIPSKLDELSSKD